MNNSQQQRLDQLASEQQTTRLTIIMRAFFRFGSVNEVADYLQINRDTLRDMLRFNLSMELHLIPIPTRNVLLTDEERDARLMDWMAAFCIRELKDKPMPEIEKALRRRNQK